MDIKQYISNGYFRYDVYPESTADENWDLYCELSEELKKEGYEFVEPYIEHDCISGEVRKIQ